MLLTYSLNYLYLYHVAIGNENTVSYSVERLKIQDYIPSTYKKYVMKKLWKISNDEVYFIAGILNV